jgi:hypothetical protein
MVVSGLELLVTERGKRDITFYILHKRMFRPFKRPEYTHWGILLEYSTSKKRNTKQQHLFTLELTNTRLKCETEILVFDRSSWDTDPSLIGVVKTSILDFVNDSLLTHPYENKPYHVISRNCQGWVVELLKSVNSDLVKHLPKQIADKRLAKLPLMPLLFNQSYKSYHIVVRGEHPFTIFKYFFTRSLKCNFFALDD